MRCGTPAGNHRRAADSRVSSWTPPHNNGEGTIVILLTVLPLEYSPQHRAELAHLCATDKLPSPQQTWVEPAWEAEGEFSV